MPLSFREYLSFKGVTIEKDMDSHKEVEINRLFDAGELERKEVIQEYFRTLVQRDLIERFAIKEEALLNATIKLILNSLLISISKLTNTLQSMGFRCSKNTISNYITFMEKSFFLYQALFFSTNVKDQMQYPRKVYFVDNGFLKYLSLNPDKRRSLENLAAEELKRRGYDLYYWRNTREREIRALKKGLKDFGLEKGIILTDHQGESIKEEEFEIGIIPICKWLLGHHSPWNTEVERGKVLA